MLLSYRLIKSENALEENGTEEIKVKRSFKERFLQWPFNFWVKEKTISVPAFMPAIIIAGNTIIYHPYYESYMLKWASGGTDAWDTHL